MRQQLWVAEKEGSHARTGISCRGRLPVLVEEEMAQRETSRPRTGPRTAKSRRAREVSSNVRSRGCDANWSRSPRENRARKESSRRAREDVSPSLPSRRSRRNSLLLTTAARYARRSCQTCARAVSWASTDEDPHVRLDRFPAHQPRPHRGSRHRHYDQAHAVARASRHRGVLPDRVARHACATGERSKRTSRWQKRADRGQ